MLFYSDIHIEIIIVVQLSNESFHLHISKEIDDLIFPVPWDWQFKCLINDKHYFIFIFIEMWCCVSSNEKIKRRCSLFTEWVINVFTYHLDATI